jgi:hypothetical protein
VNAAPLARDGVKTSEVLNLTSSDASGCSATDGGDANGASDANRLSARPQRWLRYRG